MEKENPPIKWAISQCGNMDNETVTVKFNSAMSTLFVELDEVDANSKSPFAVFVCKPKHNENKTITCGLMLGFIKIK